MANLKKTMPSGSTLEVTLSPFSEGHALYKAVARELETIPLAGVGGILGTGDAKVKDLLATGVTDDLINTIKNAVLRLSSSEPVGEALKPCMQRATLNGVKITGDAFEAENTRGDFLVVYKEVLAYNVAPFLGSLGSMFTGLLGGIGSAPP